jgi:acetone carboxylase gamma subunit
MVTTSTSSIAALLVVVSSFDFIMAFHSTSTMIAKTISSLDSRRPSGLCQIASAMSPIIRRDNAFTLSYLRTVDNNVDYIQEFVEDNHDHVALFDDTTSRDMTSISCGVTTTGHNNNMKKKTIDIDAELEYITQRNVLLAREIETMEQNVSLLAGGIETMEDAAFWRIFQQEEEELNDHDYYNDFLSTDEEFIDSMANMLLERPVRRTRQTSSSTPLSVAAPSYL